MSGVVNDQISHFLLRNKIKKIFDVIKIFILALKLSVKIVYLQNGLFSAFYIQNPYIYMFNIDYLQKLSYRNTLNGG